MVRSRRGWLLTAVALALFVFRDTLVTTTRFGTGPPGPVASVVNLTAEFWWLLLVVGAGLLVRDYGLTARLTGDDGVGGLGPAARASPVAREDVIRATNWKRVNFLVFRRSVGVSLAAAGAVAAVVTLLIGGGGLVVTAVSVVVLAAGLYVFLTSRSHEEEIQHDHTHRVSVTLPDLFEVHSFHVHLRQMAEDLGYVTTDSLSPGTGGTAAAYDEEVFLSEGGFVARKRPIAPPISPFPAESTAADLCNLTSLSMSGLLVGPALVLGAPGGLTVAVAVLLVLGGVLGLLYSYVTRTRNWAKLYCITEGTVHTPTANLYDEGVAELDHAHAPTVSSPEATTELLVTVGARSSRYFDDDQLAEDFEAFVAQIDDVARENSRRVLQMPLGESDDRVTQAR